MTTVQAESGYRRAVVLMTATSFLVPAAGLVTAPILARALSTDGRGELAAALAPAGLMLAAATMGLPDAMTFYVAKRPEIRLRAQMWTSALTTCLGAICILVVVAALPFLRNGDPHLGHLIALASVLTIPALVVGVFRGTAMGLQMWGAVASERAILTVGRLVTFGGFYVAHSLTLLTAVLINVLLPIVAGCVYLPMLSTKAATVEPGTYPDPRDLEPALPDIDVAPTVLLETRAFTDERPDASLRAIVSFGSKVWFGSVASMVLDRSAPLLMAPLSSVKDLGLYTVANNVSDLPLIVALAIAGTLYGMNAKSTNINQVTSTSRLSLLACLLGFLALAGSIHWWIGPLFGSDFNAAAIPTLLLTAGSLICIPGLMAASALTAWGRPALRSISLLVTLIVNLSVFVILVPRFGVYGACWTSLISSLVLSAMMVGACTRIIDVHATEFVAIRASDVVRLYQEGLRLSRRILPDALKSRGRHGRERK